MKRMDRKLEEGALTNRKIWKSQKSEGVEGDGQLVTNNIIYDTTITTEIS